MKRNFKANITSLKKCRGGYPHFLISPFSLSLSLTHTHTHALSHTHTHTHSRTHAHTRTHIVSSFRLLNKKQLCFRSQIVSCLETDVYLSQQKKVGERVCVCLCVCERERGRKNFIQMRVFCAVCVIRTKTSSQVSNSSLFLFSNFCEGCLTSIFLHL